MARLKFQFTRSELDKYGVVGDVMVPFVVIVPVRGVQPDIPDASGEVRVQVAK